MDRRTFDKILIEEGINDAEFRDVIWNERHSDNIDEQQLRQALWQLKQALVRD